MSSFGSDETETKEKVEKSAFVVKLVDTPS